MKGTTITEDIIRKFPERGQQFIINCGDVDHRMYLQAGKSFSDILRLADPVGLALRKKQLVFLIVHAGFYHMGTVRRVVFFLQGR